MEASVWILLGSIVGYILIGILTAKVAHRITVLVDNENLQETPTVIFLWPIAWIMYSCGAIVRWVKKK